MKLTCISCQKRAEISMETQVNWYYVNKDNSTIHIFQYIDEAKYLEGRWKSRLLWVGGSNLQDLSIIIVNVSLNDTGTYKCEVIRKMTNMPAFVITKFINLVVREEVITMSILLALLSFWLLVVLVHCFRKIARAEVHAQDSLNDCLAIPTENKDDAETIIED
ncbi:hypothetical protein SKAU_G00261460 [Synaphobranchus kaupii]|uniref:Sodium channel regulatory subunit beta-3 n=1 Tax=Synaphobranchus kaupii TaxID=118154 RepID=A0A9Q1EYG3_SYNKA|nr:hypothetical protein SKAU_G00261460 [Synaphobranchus kaupii]